MGGEKTASVFTTDNLFRTNGKLLQILLQIIKEKFLHMGCQASIKL